MAATSFPMPDDRYYEPDHHLWVKRHEASGRVLIGIDAIGLDSLGELAYIELPQVETPIARGKSLGTLEAAKMTGPIVAPVSGSVTARNENVLKDPLLVNRDSYQEGWLLEVHPSNWDRESRNLIAPENVADWAQREAERQSSDSPTEE